MPLVRRTRATLRSAEFGFFGVVVYTRVQTPRRCGEPFSAGVFVLPILSWRPLRTSCWIVGMRPAISSFELVVLLGVAFRCSVEAHAPAIPLLLSCRRPVPEVGRVALARASPRGFLGL